MWVAWTLARECLTWEGVETTRPLSTGEITEWLESAVDVREIVRRMVATGNWTEAGAVDFVSWLVHGAGKPASSVPVQQIGRRRG